MNGAREEQNYELQRVIRYGELSPKASRRSGPCVNPVFEGLEPFFGRSKSFGARAENEQPVVCNLNRMYLKSVQPPLGALLEKSRIILPEKVVKSALRQKIRK